MTTQTHRNTAGDDLLSVLDDDADVRERVCHGDRLRADPAPDVDQHRALRERLPRERCARGATSTSVRRVAHTMGKQAWRRTAEDLALGLELARTRHGVPEPREPVLVLGQLEPTEEVELRVERKVERRGVVRHRALRVCRHGTGSALGELAATEFGARGAVVKVRVDAAGGRRALLGQDPVREAGHELEGLVAAVADVGRDAIRVIVLLLWPLRIGRQ